MNCKVCGDELRGKHGVTARTVRRYQLPYKCPACGGLKSPYRAINGIVFIHPLPAPPPVTSSILILPQTQEKSELGIILSVGPGLFRKDKQTKKQVWVPSDGFTKGDQVVYDKTVPWGQKVRAANNQFYSIVICSILDVYGVVDEQFAESA